ncbi:MAG TPA: toll/interleukin-1 receptor domain-containing protein, partial [Terriglobales bacterium]
MPVVGRPDGMHPKVFISHASEDKERFVLAFAERLRASGVDAWLDRWEMLPGDSLVDKIFEEGLRHAAAVVVVLSRHSVVKPWVREELNAAFVKRVNAGSKLIPVVLDDCEVPEALASTVWERISDLSAYDESFNRILAAVTGARDKPKLGALPGYITSPVHDIGGLARIDNLVLRAACELAMNHGHEHIDGVEIRNSAGLSEVPEQELADSLDVLEQDRIVAVSRHLGPGLPHFRITTYGFQQYARAYVENYDNLVKDVALSVVN